ncbi:MAG: hydroxymethylbilane synthase [Bacteriovoracaceae bacterium]|nr:hydroxymethylbilane synthase [Bacteriovoracaceae bacterium]
MRPIRVGTRPSLLARVQSQQILDQINHIRRERGLPNVTWELVTIKTTGDVQLAQPLWQMEGQNFFTKELDVALQNDQVDVVVHSFKDLGVERPKESYLAAITKRHFPHDCLIMSKDISSSSKSIRIGTSSPRRNTLVKENLEKYLPVSLRKIPLEFEMLRGNVPTRLEKLQNKKYDAIILAAAGLDRLCADEMARIQILPLLNQFKIKLLPLGDFPPSAGQGALAIEGRIDHERRKEIDEIFSLVNCERTKNETLREKQILKNHGGGCHLPLGIYVKSHPTNHSQLMCVQGIVKEKKIKILQTEWSNADDNFINKIKFQFQSNEMFVGMNIHHGPFVYDSFYIKSPIEDRPEKIQETINSLNPNHLNRFDIITSKYALKNWKKSAHLQFDKRLSSLVFAAGSKTHEHLANEDIWVHGDLFGNSEEWVEEFQNSSLVRAMANVDFDVNVNVDVIDKKFPVFCPLYFTQKDSKRANVVPSYEHLPTQIENIPKNNLQAILSCKIFFWSSYPQYLYYKNIFRVNSLESTFQSRNHFCGLGFTAQQFSENKILVHPISGPQELTATFLNQS